jgi:hypothetical protein
MNIQKKLLKDIVHQMIGTTLQGFDLAFDESKITEEDKNYCLALISKYENEFF